MRILRNWRALVVFVWIMVLISGCATSGPLIPPTTEQQPTRAPGAEGSENGWWTARFQIKWEDEEPSWYMDLFLANSVISPVLDQYRNNIDLWRFHRRAARDQTGHQFSFIFYCSAQTAHYVFKAIRGSRSLEEMKNAGGILQDLYDDTSVVSKPNIQDTSDPKWSSPIKKSWPYFIMGVSEMWLDLIKQISAETPDEQKPHSIEGVKAFYEHANQVIVATWREEGRHAFLHHLNALFGYEYIAIYERRMMRF